MPYAVSSRTLLALLCSSAFIGAPLSANADQERTNDAWQYNASIYLWGAAINGETARGVVF
jgi:hypothetical protein